MPARDCSLPRSDTYQPASASPTVLVTRRNRPIGGMRDGVVSRGTSARVRARTPSSPRRHCSASGSTIQGASALNAPIVRSGGVRSGEGDSEAAVMAFHATGGLRPFWQRG